MLSRCQVLSVYCPDNFLGVGGLSWNMAQIWVLVSNEGTFKIVFLANR